MAEAKSTREVILRREDWREAVAFYRDVLGFAVTYEDATIIGLETGAFKLYVEKGANHGPVFEMLVGNEVAAKKELLAAGCEIVEEDASVPRCYIRDPFGLTFNLGRAKG